MKVKPNYIAMDHKPMVDHRLASLRMGKAEATRCNQPVQRAESSFLIPS
ncbi:MAG: hypothetical protein FWD79_02565 [Desulfobulbus sp.]|nr:hypothetical protein [Desulfobulbus sp.]